MKCLTFAMLFSLLPVLAHAAPPDARGTQPPERFSARDIFAEYNLPALRDRPSDDLRHSERADQVLARAERLGWTGSSATAAWMASGDTYATDLRFSDAAPPSAPQGEPVRFNGTTASALNAVLAAAGSRVVKVTSPTLRVDVPIRIQRSGLDVDFGSTQIVSAGSGPFLLRVEGVNNVHVRGGVFTGPGWGVLVSRSERVAVCGVTVQHATGGIVVTDGHAVVIRDSRFTALQEVPILLHGDTQRSLLLQNQIVGNLGDSNWHAGLVITDRNADVVASPRNLMRDDNYGVKEQPITTRLAVPTDNVIAFNRILGNSSSGIYSDGGSRNVYVQNSIEGNAKEGFCLDNGSTANVVISNVIRGNGKRWGKTDADLKRDFVFNLGRLPDGSSPAKLPGLSIDNAAFNQILFNDIHENYGGGIKMVRTAFYNVIGMNVLNENNEGRSNVFHFFGIELGAATADVKVPDLDFRPSRGNEVFGNTIRGKHYAGIFFAPGSDMNSVFDNGIFGATDWAMESVQPEKNLSFNNLSNLRCRNVSTGLDPDLVNIGNGK